MKTPDLSSNSHNKFSLVSVGRVIIIGIFFTFITRGIAGASPSAFSSPPVEILKIKLNPEIYVRKRFKISELKKFYRPPSTPAEIDRLNSEIQCLSMVWRSA